MTIQTRSNAAEARNAGIGALRGLSILLVVLHHTGLRIPLKRTMLASVVPHRLLVALNYNGYESVFVFFVISGFLIARHALQRWHGLEHIDLRAFYVRRISRIAPCLVALVAVLAVLDLLGVPDYVIWRAGQSLPRAIVAALGLHLNWYEGHTSYLPGGWDVLWSLSIEEVFYLAFPLACLLTRSPRVLIPPLLLLALSLPFTHAALSGNEIWQEKAYLPGMAAIATGVLTALVVGRLPRGRTTLATMLGIVGALGLASIFLIEDLLWSSWHDGTLLLLTGSVACLLLSMAWPIEPRPRPWRALGWLRSFGQLSYEIYLTHMFVVYAGVRLFHACGGNLSLGYLWYVPIVLVCWLLGALVARYFAVPCERACRRRWLKAPEFRPSAILP